MTTPPVASDVHPRSGVFYGFVTFLVATSGIVWIEPAPVDLLTIGGIALIFAAAMRVPVAIGTPLFWLVLLVAGNILGVLLIAARPPALDLGRSMFFMSVTIYMILAWFFFTCVVAESPARTLAAIWRGWLFAALVSAVLVLGGYFHVIPGSDLFVVYDRGKALFKDPNVYGPFLIPPLLYLTTRMERSTDLRSIVRMGVFLVLLVGVLLSFSRAALASMVVAFVAYVAIRVWASGSPRQMARALGAGLVIAVFGVGALAIFLSETELGDFFFQRMQLFHEYDVGQSGRFSVQLQALSTGLLNPLGIGPGQAEHLLPRGTHNLYLRVLTENGWLGLIGLLGFIAITMWRGLLFCLRPGPLAPAAHVVYASLIGVLANSIFVDTLHWRHFFLLLGMMWGLMLAYGRADLGADAAHEGSARSTASRARANT